MTPREAGSTDHFVASLPLHTGTVSHTRSMVLRKSIRVTRVQARAYHTPLGTLIPIPPSTRRASLHGTSEPHIGTVATSQFPRSRQGAHWEATTAPPKSFMARPYMSPTSPAWSCSPRVSGSARAYMQQCVTYLHLRGVHGRPPE